MWGYIKGLDWESVFPYMSMFWKDEDLGEEPVKILPKTNYFVETPLNPIHWFNPVGNESCPTGFVYVAVSSGKETIGFGQEPEKVV